MFLSGIYDTPIIETTSPPQPVQKGLSPEQKTALFVGSVITLLCLYLIDYRVGLAVTAIGCIGALVIQRITATDSENTQFLQSSVTYHRLDNHDLVNPLEESGDTPTEKSEDKSPLITSTNSSDECEMELQETLTWVSAGEPDLLQNEKPEECRKQSTQTNRPPQPDLIFDD